MHPPTQLLPQPVSEVELVAAAKAGDGPATEALFRRYFPRMNRLAARLLGSQDDVDDVIQESFIQVIRSFPRLVEPDGFSGWLSTIVVRAAQNHLRRHRLLARLGLRTHVAVNVDQLLGHDVPADVRAEARAIYHVLGLMPPKLRVPWTLHRIEGYSLPETAALVGVSLSSVKRHIAAAEAFVASRLRREGRA